MSAPPARLALQAAVAVSIAGAAHSVVNAALLRRPPQHPPARGTVAVLVPARDEAGRIVSCLRSAVGQVGVDEVVVLDDGSTDATAGLAAGEGARVLAGTDPPPGWLGKPWACAQLAAAVDHDVLAFVDADVRLAPGAVRAAVALLESSGLDVVCPFPRQVAGSPVERLVQPLLAWSWLTTLPLRVAERSSRPSLTAACGQFVVFRRAALEHAGGFAAVRGEVLDDLALVRAVKAAGGRGGVVDGSALASCRMYGSAGELRTGYAKSLWTAFGSPAGALAVSAGLSLVYVGPAVAMLRGSRLGALGYAAGVTSRAVAAARTGSRVWPDALAHPVSVLAFTGLALDSLRARRRGTLRWRGRPLP
ncbi:glycosyltransferase family 2 protein [Jatrophihabitans endophyticus]|uniref:glycosyltransferase n=1 Tax=Jatrophihabitans endophyticus TaxID=1206085 RepID=UPI001A060184|nr:glycosyltransferase [Jatrophihabitans endophyticus]MBE7189750.1 glycosyltransferase [Jatrophihabitans endophyticus]